MPKSHNFFKKIYKSTDLYLLTTYAPTYLVDLLIDWPGDRAGDKTYTQATDLSTSVTIAHR